MITRCLPAPLLRSLVPAALLLAGGAFASTASAQSNTVTPPTVITSVPYSITTSGKYVLPYNMSYTAGGGPAITISVSNVSLDLGGYYVSGSGNTASTTPVISVGDVAGVVIKNGTLANEGQGIEFTGSTDPRDYTVTNVTFTHLYNFGVHFDHPVIAGRVYGSKFSLLGSTAQGGFVAAVYTFGGVRVEKNSIDPSNPAGNSNTYGMETQSVSAGGDFAIGNTISNCQYGIGGYTFLNNLTTNVQFPFFGNNATGNLSIQPNTNND